MSDVALLARGRLRRRRRVVRITIALTVLLLLLSAIVISLSWLPQMRVSAAVVEGASTLSTSTIETAVLKTLSGTYGYLIPKNNILLYSKDSVIGDLIGAFPPIQSASVRLENFHTLRVSVVERTPVALWCGLVPAESVPCVLLDSSGAAYAPAAEYSGDVYVHYYGDLSTSTMPQHYLGPDQFEELHALIVAIRQSDTETPRIVAVDEHADVYVTFSSGFVLMFSGAHEEGIVRNRFDLAIKSGPFADKKLSDFEYLDLRFGDKLYYKPK